MHKTQIKYLEGSFALCSDRRADYLFLLRLKAFYNQGYIKHFKGFLRTLSEQLGESRQTCNIRLNSLKKRSWITHIYKKEELAGYKIISYDDLWKSIGVEFKAGGKGFKNARTIYKIPADIVTSKKKLFELISTYDLSRTSNRMTRSKKKKATVDKTETHSDFYSVFCSISGQGIASTLGYKSKRKGYSILKSAESSGVIEVERRTRVVAKNIHAYAYKHKKEFTTQFNDTARFKSTGNGFGYVIQRDCNRIRINDISLLYDQATKPTNINQKANA